MSNTYRMPSPLLNNLTKRMTRNNLRKFITEVGLTVALLGFGASDVVGYNQTHNHFVRLFICFHKSRQLLYRFEPYIH